MLKNKNLKKSGIKYLLSDGKPINFNYQNNYSKEYYFDKKNLTKDETDFALYADFGIAKLLKHLL